MLGEGTIFLIHLFFGLPVVVLLSSFTAFFVCELIWFLDDKYNMDLFKTAVKNQKYLTSVKNAKDKLREITYKELDAESLMRKANEKMKIANQQHKINVADKKTLDQSWRDLENNAALFTAMQDKVPLVFQKHVISRTCDVISKMTTSSTFAKKMKPYIVSAEVLNNYAMDNQVRRLLNNEFEGDPNKEFVLQAYDNAVYFHYSPVIVAWALYELLHHSI